MILQFVHIQKILFHAVNVMCLAALCRIFQADSSACEHDKVLFGQLLKLNKSRLWISKEIFRFSTFDGRQETKLRGFLSTTPDEKFIIKPTNSSLTNGVIVLSKEQVMNVILLIADAVKKIPKMPENALRNPSIRATRHQILQPLLVSILQKLVELIYPNYSTASPLIQELIQCELEKFFGYWLQTDVHTVLRSDRDFFLVEAYKPPKLERDETNKCSSAVASRGYFAIPNIAERPLKLILESVLSKRCYKKDKLGADGDGLVGVSYCQNVYTYNFRERHKEIDTYVNDYAMRAKPYQDKVTAAFAHPNEQSWLRMLVTSEPNEFIEKIKSENLFNQELLEYLTSESISSLNLKNHDFCWHCFKISPTPLKKCAACNKARYCNADCQRPDWKSAHKLECSILKER